MEELKENLLRLINEKIKVDFNLDNDYSIYIFETEYPGNPEISVSVRIVNLSSPRVSLYSNIEYITPTGTPRLRDDYVEDSPRDSLGSIVSKSKDEFVPIFEGMIKSNIKTYVSNFLEVKCHVDRITIRFKYKNDFLDKITI